MAKTDTLKDIVSKKKERIALAKQALPEETLKERVKALPERLAFCAKKKKTQPRPISLIAEIKKQSPSHGLIRPDFSPAAIAPVYQEAGAQAISVLTEEDFFSGSPAYIQEVKNAASMLCCARISYSSRTSVYESRYYGADANPADRGSLSKDALAEMILLADSLGLACLVEVHTKKN
jgi:indole-3-glycerol phosphate synthase